MSKVTPLDVTFCVHDRAIPIKKNGRLLDTWDTTQTIPFKDLVLTVPELTAMELREELKNTEPGVITFPSKGVHGTTAIGWVTGRANGLRSLHGQLKKRTERYKVEPISVTDLENRFLQELKKITERMGKETKLSRQQVAEETVHAMLDLFNGVEPEDRTALRYRMVPLSNPEYNKSMIRAGKQPYPNTEHLENDPNLMFTEGTAVADFLKLLRQ